MNRSILRAIVVSGSFAIAATASATTVYSTGTCTVNDVTDGAAATSCYGAVAPTPVNDSNIDVNTVVTYANLSDYQSSTDPTTGLFGYTDWVQMAKVDASSGTSGDLTVGSGTWSWSGDLTKYDHTMIVLKQSDTFMAYLFNPAVGNSGTWSTAGFGQTGGGLSHFTVYADPAVVPLPATGILLLSAFGGSGFVIRRRRKSKAKAKVSS